jgi:hypothetical protein
VDFIEIGAVPNFSFQQLQGFAIAKFWSGPLFPCYDCFRADRMMGSQKPTFTLECARTMELVPLDHQNRLYLSPDIDDWTAIRDSGITAVIDLEGDVDHGIPTVPDNMLYVYYPIYDDDLPDLNRLHAVAKLGASLIENGHCVLSHCGLGLNRSALIAGLILHYLGMSGKEAVGLLREKRPGALYNDKFAAYLESLAEPTAKIPKATR